MPPRKKPSSKKLNSNQQSQPSKFGIEHFFERHSQNVSHSQKISSQTSDSKTDVSNSMNRGDDRNMGRLDSKDAAGAAAATAQKSESRVLLVSDAVLASENPKVLQRNDASCSPLNTTPENLIAARGNDGDDSSNELSPEFSKSVSLKRFKFSPGMVTLDFFWFCSLFSCCRLVVRFKCIGHIDEFYLLELKNGE